MKTGNMVDLIEVIENEALSLHALIISSSPSFMLLKPNTIEIISSVWDYRQQTGLPVGFTMDAGPNVHLLYPSSIEGTVRTFIDEKLKQFCESEQVIHDHVGNGPVKLA
jgi:diphosphomevalonate decarboxylase